MEPRKGRQVGHKDPGPVSRWLNLQLPGFMYEAGVGDFAVATEWEATLMGQQLPRYLTDSGKVLFYLS